MGAMSPFWNQLLSVSFTSLKSEIRKWRDHLKQGQKEYVCHNWDVERHGWTWDFIRPLSLSHLVLALFSSAMVLFSGWLNLVKRMTFTMPIMTAQLEMLKVLTMSWEGFPSVWWEQVPTLGRVEPASSESHGLRKILMEWEWDGFSKIMRCWAEKNYVCSRLATLCGPWVSSISITWELLEMQVLASHRRATESESAF